jgi:hypothetical protein
MQVSKHMHMLVGLLHNHDLVPPQLVPSILVALANIFDTPFIVMPLPQLGQIIKCLLTIIGKVLSVCDEEKPTQLQIPHVYAAKSKEKHKQASAGVTVAFAANQDHVRGTWKQDRQRCMVAYSYGVLYNLMKNFECRAALLLHQAFIPSLLTTLSNAQFYHAHFVCLHILAVLQHKRQLPPHYDSMFFCYLQGYLAYFPIVKSSQQLFSHLGMTISPHDMADFYVPFLFSKSLDCVRLGAFVIQMYYELKTG